MAKIVDIFTGKPLKRTDTYSERFEKCQENIGRFGKCSCDLCILKRSLAYKTINFAYKKMIEYNKTEENILTWGDLLEVLIIAAKTTRNTIDADTTGDKNESKI
jgi:hypothetical protein